ncbi:hydroxyacylglutathione hydrolase [Candidatus Magnetomoraceae bacterium gMMP-15]
MIIKEMAVGPIMANCFILGCEKTKQAVVIDPGDETDRILKSLAEDELTVKYIINTHGHFDHTGGNNKLKKATNASILIHAQDAPMLSKIEASAASWGMQAENSPQPDKTIEEGDEIAFGEITLKVLHTPGHSPGGISLYTDKSVFVGDTLFSGSIGRTDLPGGNYDTLISSVKNKLFTLDDDVTVYSGHGPASTIGRERQYNPFFR